MSRREKLRKARKRERRRVEESARYLQAVATLAPGAPPRTVVSPEVYDALERDARMRGRRDSGYSISGRVVPSRQPTLAESQIRGVEGRLLVDDLRTYDEAQTMTPEQVAAARDWYERSLPGSRDGVVASGQMRVTGPLTGMSVGGYVSTELYEKEDPVSKHQDQSVSFLRDLATYLGADGWDRLQHMVCHFDPTDGSWTLSLRVEDGDNFSVFDGIVTTTPQVGDAVRVDQTGCVRTCDRVDWRSLGRVVARSTEHPGRVTVQLGYPNIAGGVVEVEMESALPVYGPVEPWLRRHACPGQFHHLGRRLSADSFALPRSEALERMASIYARMAQEARDREAQDEEIRRRASGPEPRPTAAGSP